jgi:hypothetical protein
MAVLAVCCTLQADVYERLDALDSDTTEARAASILHGLGFDKEMQVWKSSKHSLNRNSSVDWSWCCWRQQVCSCLLSIVCRMAHCIGCLFVKRACSAAPPLVPW